MKKILSFSLLLTALWSACSNDFDLTAPWKEVPVVYAILSAEDTAHYIRVEKGFLDPEKSALEVAQIADSIYYPANAITVFVENLRTKEKLPCVRVDGNLEGHPRKAGIFATTPNWLYKFKTSNGAPLGAGDAYKLTVKRADGQKDITATTTIPAEFIFSAPNPSDIPPKMNFNTEKGANVKWLGDTASAYFDISLLIRYRVQAPDGTTLLRRTIPWDAAKNLQRGNAGINSAQGFFYTSTHDIGSPAFFQRVATQIEADDIAGIDTLDGVRTRYFEGIDIILQGGGNEIKAYLQTSSANAGVTGSEIVSTYTNISEGFGIFTAKNSSRLLQVRIGELTVNFLNDGSLKVKYFNQDITTKSLNFRYL
jgi:hypothetical protein